MDEENSIFWQELCGSQAAKMLGVKDSSPDSLRRFDDWYFNFYPYLKDFLAPAAQPEQRVLEVGLGYGTVSQYLAENRVQLTAVDIAAGPTVMVKHRLQQHSLPGSVMQHSILSPGLPSESFDAVVAIGALHHTGDLSRAIARCHDALRPGGVMLLMVYYAYSYRRWKSALGSTFSYILREARGYRGVVSSSSAHERGLYDANSEGTPTPHTDWISRKSMLWEMRWFRNSTLTLNNIDSDFPPVRYQNRHEMLSTRWPKVFGLDLYVRAEK